MKERLQNLSLGILGSQHRLELALAGLASGLLLFMFSHEIKTVLSSNTWSSLLNSPGNKSNFAAVAAKKNTNEAFDVSSLVTAALAFKATLTTTQQSTLQQTYTTTLARKWSNLPCGSTCRNGIQFGNLTDTQLEAALSVIQLALGSGTNNGYDEFLSIRLAEDWLGDNGGGSGYSSDLRWIAFLNTPSETGAWMLQFGGHHYAANIAFNNGHVIGATPFFVALEPTTFTLNGTSYAPMEDEKTALRNMLASLTSAEFTTAKLSTTFSDCLMSPGESNGNTNTFPTTKQGVKCSNLTDTQKDLVITAIETYVNDMDAATAAVIMEKYTNEIDDTYIAFTGSATAGSASTFLASNSNYVRIDGPSVWIEFACQNGIVVQNQIHYHSVWRDHDSDYGVDLTGDPIDESTAGVSTLGKNQLKLYPNPATDMVYVDMPSAVTNASVSIIDISGKKILNKTASGSKIEIDVRQLAKGTYVLRISENGKIYNAKFIK